MTDLKNSNQNHEENIVNEKEEKLDNQKENTEKIKDKEKVISNGERTVCINSDVKQSMKINDVSFYYKNVCLYII